MALVLKIILDCSEANTSFIDNNVLYFVVFIPIRCVKRCAVLPRTTC